MKNIIMLVFSAFAFCSLSSCSEATPSVGASEDMIGLSIDYSQMSRYSVLSFSLIEEDGEIFFSCSFFMDDEEIKLEKVRIAPEYMQRLREIAHRYDFANMKERTNANKPFIHDAPTYRMTIYWRDKKSLSLNYWPGGGEVEKLFWELAETCINKPGAPEDISALYYNYAHANETNRFNFRLRSDNGNYLFSARYYTKDREKVDLRDVTVDTEYVRKMCELIKEHGILNVKGNPLRDTSKSAPPYPYAKLNLYWPDMRTLRLDESAPGGEELKQFFQDLAQTYREHWQSTQTPELLSWLTFTSTCENESDSFMFHLREVSASIELMAHCITKEGKKLEFHDTVDPKYMYELREIVKKHGIVDNLKKKPYPERERSINMDKPYSLLLIEWWNDPRLRTTEWPESGGEELEQFFRDLAQKYADCS